jgi:transcriptional regulator with XRE-family HTH domain
MLTSKQYATILLGGIFMLFGDRLRLLREEKNLTQKELGNILSISDRVIGYYEANDRFPKDEKTLIKISQYFNVSLDWLVGISVSRVPIVYDADSKNLFNFQIAEFPEEAIRNIQEYINFIKQKYSSEQFRKSKD